MSNPMIMLIMALMLAMLAIALAPQASATVIGPAELPAATSLPHSLNTTYYEKLVTDVFNPNLTTTIDNVENGTIIGDVKMEYDWAVFNGDQSMFWMILYGVPGLLLFWRARSPFLPCSAFIIMTPIVWPYVGGNWQMGIIVCDILAMVGVVYAFFISIRKV